MPLIRRLVYCLKSDKRGKVEDEQKAERKGRGNVPSSSIPYQRHARQRTRCIPLIAINDILIATNKHAQDAIPEQHAARQGTPIADPRIRRPSHPEHGDRYRWGAEHGEPETELGGQAISAFLLDGGEVALGPGMDEGHEETGEAEAEADAEEGEAGDALREAVRLGENEGVAVQEGEEDDVYDGQVQCDEHDDGFAEGEDERAVERMREAVQEGFVPNFHFCAIAVVGSEVSEVVGFPL